MELDLSRVLYWVPPGDHWDTLTLNRVAGKRMSTIFTAGEAPLMKRRLSF